MIMTVNEFRRFCPSEESDDMLKARIQAIEDLVRAYTNNNFMVRTLRTVASATADHSLLVKDNGSTVPFKSGDTLQITGSDLQQDMLVTVECVHDGTIFVSEDLQEEESIVITKVVYPPAVKMGAVNLLKWDLERREKVGVQSETISRHSVTYFNMDAGNSTMGFPSSMLGFLKPFKKARFGGGIR